MSTLVVETGKALGTAGDEAMRALNDKWYNTMIGGLNLSNQSFQIYQSNVPLGDQSTDLWAIYDCIPPLTVTYQAEPSEISRFSDNYNGVLASVVPDGSKAWTATMGDSLADWLSYKKDWVAKHGFPGDWLPVFRDWAQLNLPDPATAQKAITQFSQTQHGVIGTAEARYVAANGIYAYNKSLDDLRRAVSQLPSGSYQFNSATASGDISHSWSQQSSGGGFGFLWGGGSSSSRDSVNNKFAGSNVIVDVRFNHVGAFAAGPLMTPTVVGGKPYPGWFSSEALSYAFVNKGTDVWPAGGVSWEETFGLNGNLKRFATNLVVADELTMSLSSSASFSSLDQETIRSESGGGCWPFYNTHSTGGSDVSVTFNDQGNMTVTVKSPAGSPVILGVSVLPIEKIFG